MEATCTPRVERKVVAAETASSSREQASEQLQALAGLSISGKRCQRITQRVGQQRVEERQQRLEDYEALPLPQQREAPADAPLGGWDHRVAVIMVDGGRAQLRDERWGKPRVPGEERPRWWRESKVSMLATFFRQSHASDPLPEVPPILLDPLWLIPKLNDIKAAKGGDSTARQIEESLSEEEPSQDESSQSNAPDGDPARRWSPEPLVRSVVATFEPYDTLGRLAKVEAYHRGFTAAKSKAFVGDGLASNWKIHQTYFSDYTPILDLFHALTHVYSAAHELALDMEEAWRLCKTWITWIWQGNVAQVIEALDERIADASDAAMRETLEASRGYLNNNRHRMRYDEYRRLGLPITSALMESTIKRINRRIKGTEKFWSQGAEPHLQLSADKISETNPLEIYWQNKAKAQIGKRKSRAQT